MLTTEQLQKIMPQLPAAKRATLFPFLTAAIGEFAIERPPRAAAFLAQLAHESGQFRFMEEIWGPTAAQRRYEPPGKLATDLGNTETGDGKRFKGRGPIQITGRANYRRYGDLLGVDLIADPPRAALPEVAFRVAGLYWSKKGLNELADQSHAKPLEKSHDASTADSTAWRTVNDSMRRRRPSWGSPDRPYPRRARQGGPRWRPRRSSEDSRPFALMRRGRERAARGRPPTKGKPAKERPENVGRQSRAFGSAAHDALEPEPDPECRKPIELLVDVVSGH